jgi:hypothetical protein
VTINGANLGGATSVAFNGTAASFGVDSSSQITATVPAGASTGPIIVTTSANGMATSAANFTVAATPPPPTAPTISSLSPSSGRAGTSVTINGANLGGATSVTFNGKLASFSAVSPSQITTSVPRGAKTGPVRVTTGAGTSNALTFTVTR